MEIHFEKVTSDKRKAVENLQVFAEQQTFIESMAENLKESDQFPEWESAGIYDGNQLIGYAMYGRWQDGRVWLDRFLIDQRFQGQGYGKAACRLLMLMLIEKYQTNKLYLSVYDTNSSAIRLYQQLGFVFNGELDTNGERVMEWTHQNK